MGSPGKEIHDNDELEGETPPRDIVPIGTIPDADIVSPVQEPEDNAANPPSDVGPRVNNSYRYRLRNMLKKYRRHKKVIKQLKHWLKEATRTRKLKVEMGTARTQTKQCSRKDVETQTEFLVICPK